MRTISISEDDGFQGVTAFRVASTRKANSFNAMNMKPVKIKMAITCTY